MSESTIICSGCGVPVQTSDPSQMGYAPPAALERDGIVCRRCFRLKHYNEIPDVPLQAEDFRRMVKTIGQTDALLVMLVDLFDVEGSWLLERNALKNNSLLLVGNKRDLLPQSVNERKLKTWLKKDALQRGWTPADVLLMDAFKGEDIKEVAAHMDELRQGKDVYIIGSTNVGKSTFINQIIRRFEGDEEQLITTSTFPGTTLAFIDLPLDDGRKLFDTPGVINPKQMLAGLPQREMASLQPKKEIKPIVHQLQPEQTLFFGGLARMDFVKGEANHFVCYFPPAFKPHRTKLSGADALYEKHAGEDLLSPPDKHSLADIPPLKRQSFHIQQDKSDVVIPGLGWVTVGNAGAYIDVYVPEHVEVIVREAII
ncbi:ribosome biogenesis GTPase YqeH [Salicibibacter kimchii]|uniref:Ribosome biogenesis GTPase YqeH n=1 Tax=Salicibibacter kimchii TaxID=2099786 RepID=A0A345BUM4_9BACI|nr:ribosome biogenesis GTPase YqeH [Salicibibacter kimchii]AXF54655.1 ribosome biogenesis GTPase YqeH [Salicibibacter kimchii]